MTYEIWKTNELSETFLKGVRGAIPLATEQIDVLLRVVRLTQAKVDNFLDLGCGDGVLGKAIYQTYPQARGVFLDISETMLQSAQDNLVNWSDNSQFILGDFGEKSWLDLVKNESPFDIIVSGFSIHHQSDIKKQEIYQEIYQILKPGGIFLNLEHVASSSQLGETLFDELFIDSLYEFHQVQGSQDSQDVIAKKYYNRSDKTANILTLVETQCDWLRNIGFVDVDCFMKLFEIALFGGLRPKEHLV
jgi:tRNA (cmo5U34)-methyltransferase